jgi:DNA-binding NtrC family response regulator
MSDGAKPLQGLNILIIEDEFLIAQVLAEQLASRGGSAITLASSVDEAQSVLRSSAAVDCVVLDVMLNDGSAEALVPLLGRLGIPFILATGLAEAALPPLLQGRPRCDKPCDYEELARLILALCRPSHDRQSSSPWFSTSRKQVGSGDGA